MNVNMSIIYQVLISFFAFVLSTKYLFSLDFICFYVIMEIVFEKVIDMSTHDEAPMYERIQKDLMEKIQTGVYGAGDRIPSEKEITRQYQVSRITAVKALTELSLNGYISRVQGKGSFANSLDKHLRPSALTLGGEPAAGPHKISVMIPEHFDYHSGSIIHGITQTLSFPDYFVQLVITKDAGLEEYALEAFVQDGFAGVILFPVDCEFYSDIILRMHLNKFPFVLIDRSFPGVQSSSVKSDNIAGCRLAVEHLLGLGHRHIAFVADCSFKELITSVRYSSYVTLMNEHGLGVHSFESFGRQENRADESNAFLAAVQAGEITAAVVSNSHAARRLYDLCMLHGISVPNELSIVCFDLPDAYRPSADDFFTYVEQDSKEIGRKAAELLMEIIANPADIPCRQITLEPTLIVHRSTSAPKEVRP